VTSLAGAERAAVCTTLGQSAPDAPTLCAGWSAYDLAAHLVLRERRPLVAPGIALPFLARATARQMETLKHRYSYFELVDVLRTGPPRWSPTRTPRIAEALYGLELFVHHEDLRRAVAGWAPRDLPFTTQTMLWSRLGPIDRVLARRCPVGLELVRTDSPDASRVKQGEPTVVVRGLPSELVLYAYGRRSVARVELDGEPAALAGLRSASFAV
jgi:uncharacterized protein (TIGR03085 family)